MRISHHDDAPPLADPELGIWFDGRAYHYREFRYERLPDAAAYAALDRRGPAFQSAPLPLHWEEWRAPDAVEAARMAAHGIVYEHGVYCYGLFHYDLLSDALDYAGRSPHLSAAR